MIEYALKTLYGVGDVLMMVSVGDMINNRMLHTGLPQPRSR